MLSAGQTERARLDIFGRSPACTTAIKIPYADKVSPMVKQSQASTSRPQKARRVE